MEENIQHKYIRIVQYLSKCIYITPLILTVITINEFDFQYCFHSFTICLASKNFKNQLLYSNFIQSVFCSVDSCTPTHTVRKQEFPGTKCQAEISIWQNGAAIETEYSSDQVM